MDYLYSFLDNVFVNVVAGLITTLLIEMLRRPAPARPVRAGPGRSPARAVTLSPDLGFLQKFVYPDHPVQLAALIIFAGSFLLIAAAVIALFTVFYTRQIVNIVFLGSLAAVLMVLVSLVLAGFGVYYFNRSRRRDGSILTLALFALVLSLAFAGSIWLIDAHPNAPVNHELVLKNFNFPEAEAFAWIKITVQMLQDAPDGVFFYMRQAWGFVLMLVPLALVAFVQARLIFAILKDRDNPNVSIKMWVMYAAVVLWFVASLLVGVV